MKEKRARHKAMAQRPFDVSYVITVYNKADILPLVLQSIKRQPTQLHYEIIVVDDVSTDDSIAVLKREAKAFAHMRIIENTQNKGPSVRLNQGASLAKGTFLHLMDGDDLLPRGATLAMHTLLCQHKADFLYGQVKNFQTPKEAQKQAPIASDFRFKVFENPLEGVLQCAVRGVPILTKRSLFLKAGGADERLFVQDQSLPLRLAKNAKRFIHIKTPVVYAPRCGYHLSHDLKRQHHDGFLAFYYTFCTSKQETKKLFEKMVSVLWKAHRMTLSGTLTFGWFYGLVKLLKPAPFALAFLRHRAKVLWPKIQLPDCKRD